MMSEFEHKVLDPMTEDEMAVYITIDTHIEVLRDRIETNRLEEGDPWMDYRLRQQMYKLLDARAAFKTRYVEHVYVADVAKFEEAKKLAALIDNGHPIPIVSARTK